MTGPARRCSSARLLAFLVVAVSLVACGSCAPSAPEVSCPPVPAASTTFPRTATLWLDQNSLPPVDDLARNDAVVIDSEWAHRAGPALFADLRSRNPDILLLAYVNLVDYPPRLGSGAYYAHRYALWQYRDATQSTFPERWLARTAAGEPVSEWPDTTMTNLTDTAPKVDGQIFAEYGARWVADQVWASGLWDGIFLDVWTDRIYGATRDSWDIDGDGLDDPDAEIYGPGQPWERGVSRAEEIMRAAMPDAVLVGNGNRTLRGGLLDGRVFESFADRAAGRDPIQDIDRYLQTAGGDGHREPGFAMNINRRRAQADTPEAFRDARFFLTGTLLQDGYWAPTGADYEELAYYDEMDGGGLGPGYLGGAIMPDPAPGAVTAPYACGIGTVAPGVVRRDFERGVVLNNSGTEPQTVDLGGTFQRLRGRQDPATNDGSEVTSVTVQPGDGLVLLRVAG
jgi:hypothetical protein